MDTFPETTGCFIVKHNGVHLLFYYVRTSHEELRKALPLSHVPNSSTHLIGVFEYIEGYLKDYVGHSTFEKLIEQISACDTYENINSNIDHLMTKTGVSRDTCNAYVSFYKNNLSK